MRTSRVKTWLELSGLFNRAQKLFEQKSGWSSQKVNKTLESLSELNRLNKVLLGGLLLSHTLNYKKVHRTKSSRSTN